MENILIKTTETELTEGLLKPKKKKHLASVTPERPRPGPGAGPPKISLRLWFRFSSEEYVF